MKYFQLIILITALCAVGCHSTPRSYNKMDVKDYFDNLRVGTKVSKVEKDLNLPEPRKTYTPRPGGVGSHFIYWAHGLVIGFKATGSDYRNHSDFVYIGILYVDTEQEYEETLRNIMPPSKN